MAPQASVGAAQVPSPQPTAEAPTAEAPAADAPAADGPDGPSIQYLDSVAHAGDRIDFQPGPRVSVPFRPRATDRWSVGGALPRPLPAGRLSGAEMRDQAGPPAPATDPLANPDTTNADSAASTTPLASAQTVAAVGDGGLRREVLGFLPYWEVGDSSTVLDYSTLSTVAYFSVGCASAGTLLKKNSDGSTTTGWGGWTGSRMSSVITAAHQAGTRVVMTLTCFAWSDAGAKLQASILNTSTYRTALAKAVAAAVRDRGADGVNLDFEPLVSGTEAGFTAFVRALRSAFNAYAPGYEITFDTMGRMGNYPIVDATAPGGADALMIMGYDYRTASSSSAGSISPLTGPPYDLHETLSAYSAKVSPSKLLLGIPYYGRAWSTSSNGLHATNISGTKYGASATSNYANAVSLVAQYGRRWDAIEGAPWTAYQKQTCTTTYGCVTSWRELYYDDATSLGMRYDLINRVGIRGAGIWALGYDGSRPELRQALADKFLHDTTPPVTGVAALGASQRDEGFPVSWKAYDDTSVAGYDVQVSADGGAWATWLTASHGTSDVFLGADGHTYAFRARATDAAGNTSAWFDVPLTGLAAPATLTVGGFGTVTTDGLHMRSNATTSGTAMATLSKGDALSIIGGPRTGEGYTWYQVIGPVRQWGTVDYAQIGGWVAASGNGSTNLVPRAAVYATRVAAGLRGYAVGDGGNRLVTPNGDGVDDSVRLAWTNALALDALTLRIFASDGSLVGTKALAKLTAGAQTFDWNGTVGGAPVAAGNYVLQLVGTKGTTTYTAPSVSPVTPLQLTTFGVAVAPDPPTSVFSFSATTASPTRATTITFNLVFGGVVTGLSAADLTRSGTATG
ncbi:MAG TPA: glycosyl hydrolase family 18 protein, partial [Candidatus Acidoferrales bacterium]|nr:glycosyl hydrolase family 18 protein [Candidatus Acidoferrales bacterium]